MKESKSVTKDPICGMIVDTATAPHAEHDGETSYFCSEHCRDKFLSASEYSKPDDNSGDCCCG
jgi:Cu+-exporting ATPase